MFDNLNLVDLRALSEPLSKLIDTLSRGLGLATEPLLVFLNGKAESNKYLTMEKAKADAEVYRNETLAKSNVKIQRLLAQESRRQANIKDVTEIAANELKTENFVSKEPVSEDWMVRFLDDSQDISDDELKIIWGKILAGEVKTPGSYSLRTLETLKNLSRREAEVFTKACQNALGFGNYFLINKGHETETGFGLSYNEVSLLMDAGMIVPTFDTHEEFGIDEGRIGIIYQDYIFIVYVPDKSSANARILTFTAAGNEIYPIVTKELNKENVKFIASYFKNRKATKVILAKLTEIKGDNSFSYDDNTSIQL